MRSQGTENSTNFSTPLDGTSTPDRTYPANGTGANKAIFQAGDASFAELVEGRRGIVAFDKLITGDPGSAHVDLFDGARLSNGQGWPSSEKVRLWYF